MVKGIWEDWILMKNSDEDISRESVSYNQHGQWELKKSEESKPIAADAQSKWENHNKNLNRMFSQLYHASFKGDETQQHANDIKNYVKSAPKGEIDIGHLGKLIEKQPFKRGSSSGGINRRPALRHKDLAEMITPHVGDSNSMMDIWKNHGGEDALRTVLRVHGANGNNNRGYEAIGWKNPKMISDISGSMKPGRSGNVWDYDNEKNEEIHHRFDAPEHHATPHDPQLQQRVLETWDSMMDDDGFGNHKNFQDHEDAVLDRAIDQFKRHHKL